MTADTEIRSLLCEADGYVVVDNEGRRVGSFIELAAQRESDGERVAIRRDGIFLWRRLLLPLDAVERVVPETHVVVLAVDRRALDHPHELENKWLVDARGDPENGAPPSGEWLTARLEHYAPGKDEGDDLETGGASLDEQHLVFVPTVDGYLLVERDGPPPPLAGEVEAPELAGSFSVAKLAPSPLPDDARICAYLELVGSETGRQTQAR